jgi:hypothetical protein
MKKYNKHIPAAAKVNLLRQICNFIPDFLVPKLARATGVQDKARTFSPWSHLVALMYAQLTHSIGLNDVCDALGLHSGPLASLRGATPPNRNTLSHANKVRPAPSIWWIRPPFRSLLRVWIGPNIGGAKPPPSAIYA